MSLTTMQNIQALSVILNVTCAFFYMYKSRQASKSLKELERAIERIEAARKSIPLVKIKR